MKSAAPHGLFRIPAVIILLCITCSTVVTAEDDLWKTHLSFELGTVSQLANGRSGFGRNGAFKGTTFSRDQAYAGHQSAQLSVRSGSSGFGSWGAALPFPKPLNEGEDLWLLVHVYLPETFNAKTKNGRLDLIRVHLAAANGQDEGYLQLSLHSESRRLLMHNPQSAANPSTEGEFGQPVPLGKWQAIELQIGFAPQRGRGSVRVWQDTKLAYEETRQPTLKSPFSYSNYAYLFGYWDGGAPTDQVAYVDEVIATNQSPKQRDRRGNSRLWPHASEQPQK